MAALSEKRARFVAEYLVDSNATQAAIRAGYSPATAEQQGHQLLKNTSVAEAVEAGRKRIMNKLEITQERVATELAKIGFSNMLDYITIGADGDPRFDLSALTRDQAAAISELTVEQFMDGRGDDAREVRRIKFKLGDKRAALVDLGKYLGMFTEKVDLTSGGEKLPEEVIAIRVAALFNGVQHRSAAGGQ
ncbi:MAG TPA: terminase small subunit [Allosphingosinicella sp.]|jgi:phage terminase small subunit